MILPKRMILKRRRTLKILINREEWQRRSKKLQQLMGTKAGTGLGEI